MSISWDSVELTGGKLPRQLLWLQTQPCHNILQVPQANAQTIILRCRTPPSWPCLTVSTCRMTSCRLAWSRSAYIPVCMCMSASNGDSEASSLPSCHAGAQNYRQKERQGTAAAAGPDTNPETIHPIEGTSSLTQWRVRSHPGAHHGHGWPGRADLAPGTVHSHSTNHASHHQPHGVCWPPRYCLRPL